jgi:hypothetical protein
MAGFRAGPQPLTVLEAYIVKSLCEPREGLISCVGGVRAYGSPRGCWCTLPGASGCRGGAGP